MARGPSGHIEQLPSGSWRAKVYAGVDPVTRREIRPRQTCQTERAAQIALGQLLEQATAGRRPDSNVTVATLMDEYAAIAEWELSTREANEGYILWGSITRSGWPVG
jgi:integrase